jgi:hypothetical protein
MSAGSGGSGAALADVAFTPMTPSVKAHAVKVVLNRGFVVRLVMSLFIKLLRSGKVIRLELFQFRCTWQSSPIVIFRGAIQH